MDTYSKITLHIMHLKCIFNLKANDDQSFHSATTKLLYEVYLSIPQK